MKSNGYKKKCTKCKRYKSISEFNKRKVARPPKYICGECENVIQIVGSASWCKSCQKRIDGKFRQNNPGYHVKYMRAHKKGEDN